MNSLLCRCRQLSLLLSGFGLAILSLIYLFSPTPSLLVPVSPPSFGHKVSVFLCFHQPTLQQLVATERDLLKAFSNMKVEHEVFVVFSGRSPFSKHQLLPSPLSSHSRYHPPHIEIISHHTCLDVLSKAHFSTLLLIESSNMSSFQDTIYKLVTPVIQGYSDLTIASSTTELTNVWERFLYLVVSPLTGALNVPVGHMLSMHTPTWIQTCHSISDRGSFSVELVSKCSLKEWSVISTNIFNVHSSNLSRITLLQVFSLWWCLHPFLCLSYGVFLIIVLIVTLKVARTRGRGGNHGNRFVL